MSNLKAESCVYSKNQILHMQLQSFETVINFTKAFDKESKAVEISFWKYGGTRKSRKQVPFYYGRRGCAVAKRDGI
jgi:hypothetical protein